MTPIDDATGQDDDATGELLAGRYLRKELLGSGAMADVYRAEDVLLGRAVALKMMRVSADGSHPAPRARIEMALLASLNHPALVTLYDGSVEPGLPSFLVMELVDGPTLAAELSRGPLPPGEVARLAAELADGLDTVHAAGVVHRDIKPSNILLAGASGRRRAKLADFGIAHMMESERLTSPGLVVGTAAYLAPEQLRGAAPAPPADIYALGLVLREALLGERAYPDATGIGAAMARLVDSPTVPTWVGPQWHALLTRMTAADPAHRPTAHEVYEAAGALPASIARPSSAETAAMPTGAPGQMGTSAQTGPTALLPAAPALPSVPPPPPLPPQSAAAAAAAGQGARGDRRRRRGAVLAAAAIVLVAAIGVGAAWWPSQGSPDTSHSSTPTAPATPVVAPSATTVADTDTGSTTTSDDSGDTARTTREDRKAAEAARREAQKAADEAARDAEKKPGGKGKPGKD